MEIANLTDFFNCCVGNWQIERTYHYLPQQEVERSHTQFQVQLLNNEQKYQVLQDNHYNPLPSVENLSGFALAFQTTSERGEKVSQELRALFVPKQVRGQVVEGDYLRDRAYEEARPLVSHFCFNSQTQELLMTTPYTRVISVDSITLINPNLRIRKIINYQRPAEGDSLETVLLVGFGVEQKVA
jgi:hypothetical protein